MAGSKEHSRLLQEAMSSFMTMETYQRSTAALAAPVKRMQHILQQPYSPEVLEKVSHHCFFITTIYLVLTPEVC